MKNVLFAILALGIVLGFTQCKEEIKDDRTTITRKIQYDVPILNPDASHDWWIRNIEGSDREALLHNIFGRVLSGDVQAYDYFNQPLSVRDVERMLNDSVVQTLQRPYSPYAEYDTLIITRILPTDITLLRFLEEWKYDEKTLQIDKKVFAISPVLEVNINGQNITRPLFWIYTDESVLK